MRSGAVFSLKSSPLELQISILDPKYLKGKKLLIVLIGFCVAPEDILVAQ